MRVLVIGSNSISASSTICGLLREGHKVVGVSRSPEYNKVFLPYRWLCDDVLGKLFSFIRLDINKDLGAFEQLVDAFVPEIVINFAAQGMVAQSWQRPSHWYRTNLLSLVKVVDILTQKSGLNLFIQASTPEVYGDTDNQWISEDQSLSGSTPYAISKAAFDQHLYGLQRLGQLPVVLTRAANVFGPGQALYRVIPRLMIGLKSGKGFVLEGKGESIRSFIHTSDLTDAYLKIINNLPIGHTYHIAPTDALSIRELVKKTCSLMGYDFELFVSEGAPRISQDKTYILSTKKIREELGWNENVKIEKGLESVSCWVEQNYQFLAASDWSYKHKT